MAWDHDAPTHVAFDLNPPERRMPFAWIALWLLFGMLIVSQLIDYVNRNKDRVPTFTSEELTFKNLKRLDELQAMIPAAARPESEVSDGAGPASETIHVLATNRKENVYAAALYAILRHDRGESIQPEDLALLKSSNSPSLQALARIYESDQLSPEEYEEIKSAIPSQGVVINNQNHFPFATQVALGHAAKKAGVDPPKLFSGESLAMVMIGGAAACIVFTIGMVLWVTYAVRRQAGHWKPVGLPLGPMSPGLGDALALRATQYMIAFLLIGSLAGVLLRSSLGEQLASAAAMVLVALSLVALSRIPAVGQLLSLRRLGLRSGTLGSDIAWGLGGFCANLPLLMVVIMVTSPLTANLPTPEHPMTNLLREGQSGITVLLILVQAVVLAPLIEEVIFRGTLLPALTQRFGSILVAVVASGLLFAAIHPTGVSAWFPLAAIGATAAMLTYQTGSLAPAIIMHGVHNAAIVGLNLVISAS